MSSLSFGEFSSHGGRFKDGKRGKIVKGFNQPQPEETVLVGRITDLSSNPTDSSTTYRFREVNTGKVFQSRLSSTRWSKLVNSLGQASGPLVRLSVEIVKPATGAETITKTKNVEPALPEPYPRFIKDLAQLKTGWYDPPNIPGESISQVSIDQAELIVQASVDDALGDVTITPTPEGGVQIEWVDNDFEIVVAPEGWVHAFNLSDDRDEDGEKKFPQTASATSIIHWLQVGEAETE